MEVTVMPNAASVQKQQGLNQVVINKVQKMIEGKQQSVMGTITRLLEEGKIAQDFIAPIGVNLRNEDRHPVITFRERHQPDFRKDEYSGQISQGAFRRGRLAKAVVRNHPERTFGMDRAYTGAHPGDRHGNPGCTLRLVPAAQFSGHTHRIHQGSGK